MAKSFDHLARRIRSAMAFHQHDTGGGHIERQPQQRRQQQHGGKCCEIQRLVRLNADQQHHDGERDVEREHHVQQEGRKRQHHHAENHEYQ